MLTGHDIHRVYGGPQTELRWTQLHCSCGWEGSRVCAYNDYQHSMLRDQEVQHYADARHMGAKQAIEEL